MDRIKGLINTGIKWLTKKWASIQKFASSAFAAAKNFFNGILGFIKSPLSFVANAIVNLDAQSLSRAWGMFSGMASSLSNSFKGMTEGLLKPVNKIWGGISDYATSLLNKVTGLTRNFMFKKLPDTLQRVAFTLIDQSYNFV